MCRSSNPTARNVLSALRRGSIFDRLSMGAALAGVSLPIFFTGLISLELFSYKWPIFPNVHWVPLTQNPAAWASNMVLPWVTLAFLYAALYARLTRAGMLETMNEDFIRTARAKGLRERTVVVRHGLRAALTPILTIVGMDRSYLPITRWGIEKSDAVTAVSTYLREYRRRLPFTDGDLKAWSRVVLISRLSSGIPEEREQLLALIAAP